MGCVGFSRRTIYFSLFVQFVQSIPADVYYRGDTPKDATQSAYKSLLPPRWSKTNSMKPTLPYTGGDQKKVHRIMHPSKFNSKSDDSSDTGGDQKKVYKIMYPSKLHSKSLDSSDSSFIGLKHFSEDNPQFIGNEINQEIQNYANKNIVNGFLEMEEQEKKEKEEFIQFLRSILWDAEDDSEEENESEGRRFNSNYVTNRGGLYGTPPNINRQQSLLRWHGVLGRPMPQVLKKKGFAAQAYRGFEDTCYKLACTLGINKVISQLSRMFG